MSYTKTSHSTATAKQKSNVFPDRFISSRIAVDLQRDFACQDTLKQEADPNIGYEVDEDNIQSKLYNVLMQNQILGLRHNPCHSVGEEIDELGTEDLDPKLLFSETAALQNQSSDSRFSLSPVAGLDASEALNPFHDKRIISKVPYKVLDAPELQDDYYLDVVHWSKENVLAVGLGKSLYLWVAATSKVTKLHEFTGNDSVASVAWSSDGNLLAMGSNRGFLYIWDYVANKELLKAKLHYSRIGTISWSPYSLILSTGSRDKSIVHRDIRGGISPSNLISRSMCHKQEVCGLRWSPDGQYICSGGNDNKVLIWSKDKLGSPCLKFAEHKAAVKAIAWSPHQNGLLATGGGTTDRYLRLWDVATGLSKAGIDTGSQICNMIWGVNSDEIVTAHGYSSNSIGIWKSNPLKCIAQLSGHLSRVLYLSMSSDGQSIVTGSGDETLRFWQMFPPSKYQSEAGQEWFVYPSQTNIR